MDKSNGINDKSIFSNNSSNIKGKENEKREKSEFIKMPETRIIDDEMDIKLFNGFPILEELIDEEFTDMSRFEIKKCRKKLKIGKNLSTKNKNYYLYNKIEYYKNFKLIKEKQNRDLECLISERNHTLKKLKEEIHLKEEENLKVRKMLNIQTNDSNWYVKLVQNSNSLKRTDDKDIYKQKLKEFPILITKMDKKIEEIDKLLSYYQAENGNSIDKIISGLIEEKQRIEDEKKKTKKQIDEIHLQLKEIKESIRILELKNTNNK